MQAPLVDMPVPVWYVPVRQSRQVLDTVAPVLTEKVPAEQAEQTVSPAISPNVPALQVWQSRILVKPVPVAKVPALQAVQAPLVGMAVPVWYVPAWQSWQVPAELAPKAVENWPATHVVHVSERTNHKHRIGINFGIL